MSSKSHNAQVAFKFRLFRHGVSLAALTLAAMTAAPVMAQDAAPAAAPAADDDVVVVRGFRGSLQTAINEKKRSTDMVDVIKSEDIGQFPDLNLAESLQRIPGVSIDRDGGEGRTITVRGLNSEFSRTRLNGLEALATTGGKDASGGTNRGRGFDFNVFAADLFNSITVRKSLSSEIEEGSLGATVDLQTARPFDYKGFTMAASGQLGYNSLSKDDVGKRGTFMVSNRWADGKLGALVSVAWGERLVTEEATNTTRWENSSSTGTAGKFEKFKAAGASSFTNIGTDAESIKINNALHPRIPRYNHFETDQKRLGITTSFQMKPAEGTLITLDGMMAEFGANRDEWEIEAISFSRSGQGLPKTDVYDYSIDGQGTMTKATFDDVDIRAEHRFDELTTRFSQANLTWDQTWNDRLSTKLLIGASNSFQDNPEQTTFTFESYDVDGYSYDYSDMTSPKFNYGHSSTNCNPDQACYWQYSSSTASGDASLIRIRPQTVENAFGTTALSAKFIVNDNITLKAGFSGKKYEFTSTEYGRVTNAATPQTRDENAGGAIVAEINGHLADYAQSVTVAGNTYLIPNLDLIRDKFDYTCGCTNAWGTFKLNNTNSSSRTNNRNAQERDSAAYVQVDFKGHLGSMPFRGNIGDRRVTTELTATGYIGSGTNALLTTVKRSYDDDLPAFNFLIEPLDNVIVRFAAAKTMARPTLLSLTPGGGSISTGSNTITTGNPALDPVRANTTDLSFEWYPDKDTLFTVAVFKKELKSYIQSRTLPFKLSELGYNYADFGESNDEVYNVTTPINTPGGDLKGFEVNLQKPFTFLPGFLSKTGGIFNYTHVESKIQYYTSAGATTTTTANLLGLSPEAWNATLYYEGDALSGRVSVSHRDGYLSVLNPGSSADFWGKHGTTNIDSQVTWRLNDNFTLIAEGLNLTDEADDRYISYNTAQGNTANDLLYDYSKSGRQYYLGMRYKY